jgi:hypothetical protein
MWLLLADLVAARAPALHGAIAAWVAGQGQVDEGALAGLDLARLPEPAAVDPRLGLDPMARAAKAPPPAPPETAAAVFDAVHLLFAKQPLRQAGDILLAWQARATLAAVLRLGAKTRSKPRPARKPKQKRPRARQSAEQLVLPIDPRKP